MGGGTGTGGATGGTDLVSILKQAGFSLTSDLSTAERNPPSSKQDEKAPPLYRHILSGNTSYGVVDEAGKVQLRVLFGDCSSTPRETVVQRTITQYLRLRDSLVGRVNYTPDRDFEEAIIDAAEKLPS